MADIPLTTTAVPSVPFWRITRHSLGAWLHFTRLVLQAKWRQGERSVVAVLDDGERVSLAHGFDSDGTTFIVAKNDGSTKRIPASKIVCVEDGVDHGY